MTGRMPVSQGGSFFRISACAASGAIVLLGGCGGSSEPPRERPQVRSLPGWTIQAVDRYTADPEAWTPEPIQVSGTCPANAEVVYAVLYFLDDGTYALGRGGGELRWRAACEAKVRPVGTTWNATLYPPPDTPAGYAILRATPGPDTFEIPLDYREDGAAMVVEIVEKGS